MAADGDRIMVLPWFDVFGFTERTSVECPDCGQISPECEEIWSAVKWVNEHHRVCPA